MEDDVCKVSHSRALLSIDESDVISHILKDDRLTKEQKAEIVRSIVTSHKNTEDNLTNEHIGLPKIQVPSKRLNILHINKQETANNYIHTLVKKPPEYVPVEVSLTPVSSIECLETVLRKDKTKKMSLIQRQNKLKRELIQSMRNISKDSTISYIIKRDKQLHDTMKKFTFAKKLHHFREVIISRLKERKFPSVMIGTIIKCIDDTQLIDFIQIYEGHIMSVDHIIDIMVCSLGSDRLPSTELQLHPTAEKPSSAIHHYTSIYHSIHSPLVTSSNLLSSSSFSSSSLMEQNKEMNNDQSRYHLHTVNEDDNDDHYLHGNTKDLSLSMQCISRNNTYTDNSNVKSLLHSYSERSVLQPSSSDSISNNNSHLHQNIKSSNMRDKTSLIHENEDTTNNMQSNKKDLDDVYDQYLMQYTNAYIDHRIHTKDTFNNFEIQKQQVLQDLYVNKSLSTKAYNMNNDMISGRKSTSALPTTTLSNTTTTTFTTIRPKPSERCLQSRENNKKDKKVKKLFIPILPTIPKIMHSSTTIQSNTTHIIPKNSTPLFDLGLDGCNPSIYQHRNYGLHKGDTTTATATTTTTTDSKNSTIDNIIKERIKQYENEKLMESTDMLPGEVGVEVDRPFNIYPNNNSSSSNKVGDINDTYNTYISDNESEPRQATSMVEENPTLMKKDIDKIQSSDGVYTEFTDGDDDDSSNNYDKNNISMTSKEGKEDVLQSINLEQLPVNPEAISSLSYHNNSKTPNNNDMFMSTSSRKNIPSTLYSSSPSLSSLYSTTTSTSSVSVSVLSRSDSTTHITTSYTPITTTSSSSSRARMVSQKSPRLLRGMSSIKPKNTVGILTLHRK